MNQSQIILLMFLIENVNLLIECGSFENDINRLYLEFKKTLNEQNDKYLDYIKNKEESIIEKILKKNHFARMSEDIRHERSLTLLLSVTDEDILNQSGFMDQKMNILLNPAF